MPAARMASRADHFAPLENRFAFADHDLREMRERREVARRSHGTLRGNHRQHAAIQHRDERFRHDGPHAENPLARALARSASIARVACSLSGAPTPHAWLRTRFSCSWRISSREMRTLAILPKPVLTP